ncbi:Uncharacterised protein [Vibrio cholerae]|nr:Uncharacterised protein [Vibrio cholerae]
MWKFEQVNLKILRALPTSLTFILNKPMHALRNFHLLWKIVRNGSLSFLEPPNIKYMWL